MQLCNSYNDRSFLNDSYKPSLWTLIDTGCLNGAEAVKAEQVLDRKQVRDSFETCHTQTYVRRCSRLYVEEARG